jgi:hypothetical protein
MPPSVTSPTGRPRGSGTGWRERRSGASATARNCVPRSPARSATPASGSSARGHCSPITWPARPSASTASGSWRSSRCRRPSRRRGWTRWSARRASRAESWLEAAGAVAAEEQVIRLFADEAGLPSSAAGCFMSGGSIGNLSALAVARERAAGRRAVAVADTAHASVDNALHLLGLEPVPVRTGPDCRLTGDAMAAALAGRDDVGIVVASAGSTNAGVVDDPRRMCRGRRRARRMVPRRWRLRAGRDAAPGAAGLASPGSSVPTASSSIPTSGCSRPGGRARWSTGTPSSLGPCTRSTARTSTSCATTPTSSIRRTTRAISATS